MKSFYRTMRLFAGDVFFDEIRVLQPGEFDSESIIDVADHAALGLPDGNHGADHGP